MSRSSDSADNRPVDGVSGEVVRRFADLVKELSAAAARFNSRVVQQVGLSTSDYRCLELAGLAETALTAGQIAELSGLSTGAVTGVIDRLERAGFACRVCDPHDRRKVLVQVSQRQISRYRNTLHELAAVLKPVMVNRSAAELEVIERYGRDVIAALRDAERD